MCKVLTEKEAANHLGLAVQTLRNWRHQRKGPPYLKISRAVRYNSDDLEKYLRQHRIEPERGGE
jgi:predicted site-specific integrase-resolvase